MNTSKVGIFDWGLVFYRNWDTIWAGLFLIPFLFLFVNLLCFRVFFFEGYIRRRIGVKNLFRKRLLILLCPSFEFPPIDPLWMILSSLCPFFGHIFRICLAVFCSFLSPDYYGVDIVQLNINVCVFCS